MPVISRRFRARAESVLILALFATAA